jgi:hypothetical protein
MKTWIVRTNCEYSQQVTTPDGATEDDAIAEANKTDVAEWDQAWAPMEAEEE